MEKILITGGNGLLARNIKSLDNSTLAPDKLELDIRYESKLLGYCSAHRVDCIIHAAAITNIHWKDCSLDYLNTNIVGTANISSVCMKLGLRLIYISTDYVYPGLTGNYLESDPILPINAYAASKYAGEIAVSMHPASLIARTSFYDKLAFEQGCSDQLTSRVHVMEAAAAILLLAKLPSICGILNVGSKTPRSVYDIVGTEFNPMVNKISRSDLNLAYPLPADTSMNTDKFYRILEQYGNKQNSV